MPEPQDRGHKHEVEANFQDQSSAEKENKSLKIYM